MTERIKLIKVGAGHEHIVCQRSLPTTELRHFKNVTGSVMQDALNVWADLWGKLQGSVTRGVMVRPEVDNGFKPSCGRPEFLEKMWLLRHYLDFAKRFSERNT